jgi:hypothetical protein
METEWEITTEGMSHAVGVYVAMLWIVCDALNRSNSFSTLVCEITGEIDNSL